ncbi:hypothetical protein J3R30DRAFT_3304490 [Lentinula aciculospora]|uniref:Uncharacterized protein n=1 Tax=Lentinula aciculospora TaxID=153920 RepID=A0A9W8ZWH5_9AGAR|nr:hypothetical protein J3R30DRAFT_3304490 [Lentinula aciculospora]
MPRSFCIAQTLLIGFASFLLTGVCATFTMITSLAILRPGVWNSKMHTWHPSYTLTLIIFPLFASVAQITAVLRLDAVQPADDLVCDASSPEWVRFLSYAGIPLVFSIPFSCLGLMALVRASRTQLPTIERSHNPPIYDDNSNLTSLPPKRTRRKDMSNIFGPRNSPTPIPTPRAIPSPSPSVAYPTSPGRAPINPGLSSPVLSARQFHLPFSPLPVNDDHDPLSSCHSSTLENQDDTESLVSSIFPTFAPPSHPGTPNARESPAYDFIDHLNYVDAELDYVRTHGKNQYEFGKEAGDTDAVGEAWTRAEDGPSFQYTTRNLQAKFSAIPSPRPALWRIVIFQLSFTLILVLACISTLIDVISRRTQPMPFGTQHVALLLAAWSPVVVFGSIPPNRRNLTFWKRPPSNS